MASSISTSTVLCPLPSSSSKLAISAVSCTISHPKSIPFHLSPLFSPLNRGLFLPWNGLKHLGILKRPNSLQTGRKSRCKGKLVYASLFGVGAPEALVIGVVALLVFGPKGLAEVARNLGKTLRAFQPTIRELQEVSREFKSTLEREIGLDDISSPTQNTYNPNPPNIRSTPSSTASADNSKTLVDPNGLAGPNRAYSSEEYLKITEEQLKASAAVAQQEVQTPLPGEGQIEPQTQPPGKSFSDEEEKQLHNFTTHNNLTTIRSCVKGSCMYLVVSGEVAQLQPATPSLDSSVCPHPLLELPFNIIGLMLISAATESASTVPPLQKPEDET